MNSKRKKTCGLKEISMRQSNYCMFLMKANRSKVFKIINRRTFYIFPAVFIFCKKNILLFSSLLKIITASVGCLVDGRWVGGFNKTPWATNLVNLKSIHIYKVRRFKQNNWNAVFFTMFEEFLASILQHIPLKIEDKAKTISEWKLKS